MTVSNKKLLLALALFALDEVAAFAIPSLGTSTSVSASCQRTTTVTRGDDCAALAKRCNISINALLRLNSDNSLCSNLYPGQLACCGKGLENRSPADADEEDDSSQQPTEDAQGSEGDDQGSSDDKQTPNGDDKPNGDDQDSNNDNQDVNDDGNSSTSNDSPNQDDGNDNDDDEKDNGNKDNGDKGGSAYDDDYTPRGNRTGNWTEMSCNHPAAVEGTKVPPQQQWEQLGAAPAFKDAVDYFKQNDKGTVKLPVSVIQTLRGPSPCACQVVSDGTCSVELNCQAFHQKGTGPAGMLIHNSLVNIHEMYRRTDAAIAEAETAYMPSMDAFIRDFAPAPPPRQDSQWLDFFLDIATTGAAAGLGKLFKAGIKEVSQLSKAADNDAVKSAAESLLSGAMSNMKNAHAAKANKDKLPDWDPEQQKDVKAQLGTVFASWRNTNSDALTKVFADDDDSINKLGNLINAGKMLTNRTDGSLLNSTDLKEYSDHFGGMMFATAAPLAWRMSNNLAFILDMQANCADKYIDYDKNRIDAQSFDSSKACVDNKLYYLAMVPEGKTEDCPTNLGHTSCTHQVGDCPGKTCTPIHFAHPPGIDNLDGKHAQYANTAAEDIIKGSLETHKANGNKNGGGTIDYNKIDTFLAMSDDKPIIAGMYRLPICNVQVAVKNWKTGKRTDDNYPC